MKKLTAAFLTAGAILVAAPVAFAQDTIKNSTPSMVPDRGAGGFGAGAPGVEPRENQGPVDGTAGRSAAPGSTVGTAGQQALPPNPGNR